MCEVKNGVIEVDVYRKPTSTERMITSDSFDDHLHKVSAYHAIAHFVVNIPLTEEKVAKEIDKIIEIGNANGYHESAIRNIISRHQKKKVLSNMSTFYDLPEEQGKRVAIRYFPNITKPLRAVYMENDLELVHRNDGSLRQVLKDKPLDLHKSGIYQIQCGCCGRYYFGMTKYTKLYLFFTKILSKNGLYVL